MRLHRVRVENFRGTREREVTFPDHGVIVLEGPNETGKSSLVEAIDLVLTEKHTARKAGVTAVRPVHRDSAPMVEIDLSSGPYRFVLSKRWLNRPTAELRVLTPRDEQLTGDAAHERVRQILDETLDTGLWNALRVLQGSAPDTSLAGSSALAAALDTAAGSAETTESPDGATTLLDAAAQRAAEFWTPKGNKPTGRLRAAEQDAVAARARAARTAAALAALAEDVDRSARLGVEVEQLAATVAEAAREADELAARVSALDGVRAEAGRTAERAQLLEGAATNAAEALLARRAAVAALAAREERLATLTAEALARQPLVDRAVQDEAEAEAGAETARAVAERAHLEVTAARAELQRRQARAELDEALAAHQDLLDAVTAAEAARPALAAATVTGPVLRRLQELDAAAVVAEARCLAAAATVEVHAVAVGVDVLDKCGATVVAAGSTAQRAAVGELTVDVAGFATVRVLAGADARELDEAAGRARAERAAAFAAAGVADLAQARAAHERHQEATAALRAALTHLDGLTRRTTLAEAGARVERARSTLDALPAAGPDEVASPAGDGDGPEARLAAARATEADALAQDIVARTAQRAAEEAVAERRRDLDRLRTELAGVRAGVEAEGREVERARACLADARAGAADDDLARTAEATAGDLAAARIVAERAAGALAALDPAGLTARAEAVRTRHERAAHQLRGLSDERQALRAHLAYVGDKELQADDDEARTALSRAEHELASLTRRAEAARLLHDTLHRHRQAARQRYVTPFGRRLVALGTQVFGEGFDVDLDEDLRILTRTLHGRVVPWADLSTGAREQLAVLTRLACAAIVDPSDGVPVVLDDALGHSDPERVRRLGRVLAQVGPTAQVLVLSPGPALGEAVPGAAVMRLTADPEDGPGVRSAAAAAAPAATG
ncbi:AAA family ATPase [Kineococcus gynurae]|uniref:AAA family ATPase n=1 Tax=Kineococcus gynurae TaxID=452979 RepID=A0ABV5LT93_9ACTN